MIYEIGSKGLTPCGVNENEKKNNLEIGRVIQLEGYDNPRYAIVKNLGISENFASYGATYLCVNIETLSQDKKQAYTLKFLAEKKDGRIQSYITDEILPPNDVLTLWEASENKRLKSQANQDQLKKENDDLEAKGRELFKKHIPETAKALICAYYDINDSDIQTDYFNHKTTKIVVLGYALHTRASFTEMRKVAGRIPETKHFESAPLVNGNNQPKTAENKEYWKPADEHRENYSMGAGYYLKDDWINSTGWRVQKVNKWHADWERGIYIAMAKRCIF